MSEPTTTPVRTLEGIRDDVERRRGSSEGYRQIGSSYGVSGGLIWHIERGHNPTDPEIRATLGLSPPLGPETQHRGVFYCSEATCSIPFIPNHPRRRKCFECSPFRGSVRKE